MGDFRQHLLKRRAAFLDDHGRPPSGAEEATLRRLAENDLRAEEEARLARDRERAVRNVYLSRFPGITEQEWARERSLLLGATPEGLVRRLDALAIERHARCTRTF